jgi:hypothetical protein
MGDCYSRLRSIGCSVETADALAPILLGLSEKKREAFYLWAMGDSYRKVAEAVGLSKSCICKIIQEVRYSV